MPSIDRPAVVRAGAALLIAMWVTQGIIALSHAPSGNHTVVGAIEHVQLATLTLCALALIPVVRHLGALAGAPRAALLALAGANTVGALCVVSNLNSGDPSFFDAVAPPSLLAWFVGFVVLGVALARRGAVPRAYAIALPLSMLIGGAGGHVGGGLVAAVYWVLLTRELGIWSPAAARPRTALAAARP